MRAIRFFPIILIIALVSILRCSGGGDIPLMPPQGLQETGSQPGDRQEAQDAVEPYSGSHQLWGYYMIEVSDDHQEVNILPMREVAQHFNVLFYLESSPCTNCVKIIDKSFPGGGVIDFLIEMRHPFPGQNYFTGFDVRGIGIFNANGTFPIHNLKYSIRETGDAEIINADGYTHLYHVATQGSGTNGMQGYIKGSMSSPQAPDGTLNAYKNFYTSDNRHFFLAGDVLQATYRVDPPQGGFIFGYAVDASWAPAQNQPVKDIPDDFGLNANSPEAYEISVTVSDGLSSNGGTADAEIWVYDWQGFSTIKSVKLEAPDLFGSLIDASFESLSGDHVIYSAEINNNLSAVEGTYDMLIAVEDTANETAPDYLDLTAYQVVEVTVEEGIPNLPPVAIAEADETDIAQGDTVNFDGTASYDPDGDGIFLWEWDLDGDGEYDDVQGFEESIVSWEYLDEGDFDVDLKVWDALSATDVLDVKIPIHVEADPCAGHTPDAKAKADDYAPNVDEQVKFTDISTDPDGFGDLAYYEWDFTGEAPPSYEPVYDPDSKEVYYTYDEGGDFYVYHRVTDMANCIDELDEPLLVEVNGPPVAAGHADVYEIFSGQQITFYSDATDPDGNGPIESDGYFWDLDADPDTGDDGYESVGEIVIKQYFGPGTFDIRHKVIDAKGLEDEADPVFQIVVNPLPDVVIHLSEEEAMNPIGAEYDFHNYFGNIGGTSIINYLDFDGPWDFTTIFPNGTFQQDIIDKNDPSVSGYNSNWPSLQYYVFQSGPSSLSGSLTEALGAMRRSYTDPPDDGVQYTYGIVDITPGLYGTIVFDPWNIMEWPLDKYTNQYDTFDWTPIGVPVNTEVWTTALGQGTVIIEVNDQEEYYSALLIRVRQRDVEQMFMTVLGDTVSYRWIADDGTELAAITAVNASTNPDNWNVASGLITGTGGIRWLYQFDLGS